MHGLRKGGVPRLRCAELLAGDKHGERQRARVEGDVPPHKLLALPPRDDRVSLRVGEIHVVLRHDEKNIGAYGERISWERRRLAAPVYHRCREVIHCVPHQPPNADHALPREARLHLSPRGFLHERRDALRRDAESEALRCLAAVACYDESNVVPLVVRVLQAIKPGRCGVDVAGDRGARRQAKAIASEQQL